MTVDLDLLRKAYPDGYLAMRGVSTVGGYIYTGSSWHRPGGFEPVPVDSPRFGCYDNGPLRKTCSCWDCRQRFSDTDPEIERAIVLGRMLPNLDPTGDPATWECAKRDLATIPTPGSVSPPPYALDVSAGLLWCSCGERHDCWQLIGRYNKRISYHGLGTEGPVTALLLARARLAGSP